MNERITKWLKNHLVNCEYTEFGWQECHRYEFDEDELKEYTALIVRECSDLAFEHWAVTHDTSPQEAILKHFGIEV